jgi:hypothetical protein
MAAPAIDQIMVNLEGMISGEIYKKGLHTSAWLDLPKQEAWPEGQGFSIKTLTWDRTLPSNPLIWQDVQASDGENGGTCIPPVQRLAFTQTLREYNLQHTSLESPDICVLDLMNSFKAQEQMAALVQRLSEVTNHAWIRRNREEYTRVAGHKYIATLGGLVDCGDTWDPIAPTSVVSGSMLLQLSARAIRYTGGRGGHGMVGGAPTFTAIGGMELLERIQSESKYRQDLRESTRVPELLAPLGVDKMFRNLWLINDIYPPRFNLVGPNWVEVEPLIWSGGKLIENPAYETAQAEDLIIYNSDVLRSIIFPTQKNYGKAQFNPGNYRGEWTWLNIQHRTENPDRNYGFFRGVFGTGTKPVFPEFGMVVRGLRCGFASDASACNES